MRDEHHDILDAEAMASRSITGTSMSNLLARGGVGQMLTVGGSAIMKFKT